MSAQNIGAVAGPILVATATICFSILTWYEGVWFGLSYGGFVLPLSACLGYYIYRGAKKMPYAGWD